MDPQENKTQPDSLLACLKVLCTEENLPFTNKAALAGLPLVEGKLTPLLFLRAAEQLGLKTKLTERPLNKISLLVLPCVLILKDNQACVLHNLSGNQARITLPGAKSEAINIGLTELENRYTGIAIFSQREAKFDKRSEQYGAPEPTSWFWGTIWHFRNIYIQVILAALLTNLFVLATPLFVMNVYDRVVPNNAIETLWALAIGVIIALIFNFLATALRGFLIDSAGKKVDVLLASRLFQHVLGMRLSSKPMSAGAFASQVREFDSLRDFFTSATLAALIDIPFLVIFLLLIAYIGGTLALIPFATVPLLILTAYFLEIPMRQAVEKSAMASMQKHSILIEAISSLETLKAQSAEGEIQGKWERFVQVTAAAGLKSRFFSSLAVNITAYMQQMVTIVVVIFGVSLIVKGELTMGGLIACTILSGRALAPLGQMTNILTRFEQSRVALNGLNQIMQLPVERPKQSSFLHRPKLEGNITFQEISFSYPNHPLKALNEVSISIKAGERVGVIGPIGAGKSTLQRLIIGFYEPSEGTLLVDGCEVSQIDPSDLRANIGYVGQDSTLFFGTVRDNILLGQTRIEDEAMLYAAKVSGVDRFVNQHPSGFDMPVGERGDGLSGGQRQAIALTRALVKKPPILLLDEPTASMDNRSEAALLEQLTQYTKGKTLLLATHRSSMLNLVDRLIVLDRGHIVADGKKEDVLAALTPKPTKKKE